MKGFFQLLMGMILSSQLCSADDCPFLLRTPEETKTFGEMRVRAIRGWDKLLTWALTPKNKKYILTDPPVTRDFVLESKEIFEFIHNYGYFSIYHPIVGVVTNEKRDIKVTNCLLASLPSQIKNPLQLQYSQDEVLAKVLAYRTLEKGMEIDLGKLSYKVDEVLNLWKGMPAYGLIPKDNSQTPILLFRGTDLSLVSEKGWASILSDLDVNGPGHSTFLMARDKIRKWLLKMQKNPPRLVGYSLGGAFVLFTLIHEYSLISKQSLSRAYNPPGVSQEILDKWKELSEEERPPHHTYVNQGDFVSQLGYFLSDVWEVSLPEPMGVIESHVTLISAEPEFTLSEVNVSEENASRR